MHIEVFSGGMDRNRSYVVCNLETKTAVVIDPFKNISIYERRARKLGVRILGVLNTHLHRDHIEGNSYFERKHIPILETSKDEVKLNGIHIKIIKTPGHSPESICFLVGNAVFTGDTLFAGRVGMTKTKENSDILFESLKKLIVLPDQTHVYPGHEYNIKIPVTMKREKENNPYLQCKTPEDLESQLYKWRQYTIEHSLRRRAKENRRVFKKVVQWMRKLFA